MALRKAIQGARHTGQRIKWNREDGTPVDLTGATISARIRNIETGSSVDSDGEFSLVQTPKMNEFNWAYGVTDVDTAGLFIAQFTALFQDTKLETSFLESWEVVEAI